MKNAKMIGDCQVLTSMGGNLVSSDSLFSSEIRNTNMNYMNNVPFHHFSTIKEEVGLLRGKDEEIESGSGSGNLDNGGNSGDEQDNEQQIHKRKRYHRHTARQIQEMEALFKECPHPDDKQRMKLSQELGLKPRQVKFWFQNRRTQMKAQQDRADNVILRAENDNLKNENFRLQSAIRNVSCPNCGGPAIIREMSFDEQHLRLENARLKDEEDQCHQWNPYTPLLLPSLDNIGSFARNFHDPITDVMPNPIADNPQFLEIGPIISEPDKQLAMELAMAARDELVRMCQVNEPLWIKNENESTEMLNLEEHMSMFSWHLKQPVDGFRTEATRDSSVVIMNNITLIDAFQDASKWMELFPSIVSRAKTIQIINSSVSDHGSGSLHLIYAEMQVISPLIPTREAYFFRYCQRNVEEGTWAIVDFPIDTFHDNLQTSFPRYRRRTSGCIVQDMPNGYSRVTWVEHAQVEDKPVHQIFSNMVNSSMAFGARRWLAVLQRQCERFASLMARNISDLAVIPSPEARKNIMKLAQRMIRIFCINMSSSDGQSWTALSDSADDTVRITTRKITEPGQPNGIILSAASTTWLPHSHHQVFDLLRDENRRSQLDVLSNGNSLHEVAHIANGSHPGNCISLFRINAASNSSQNVELMLQETCIDESGCLVVYARIDVDAIQIAMSGEDPSYIPLLPMGFVILPTTNNSDLSHSPASLLTTGLQVLTSTIPTAKVSLSSITTINNHLCHATHQITSILSATASYTSSAVPLKQ